MSAYWMWNWGDYEIWHTLDMSNRRQEFGADYPTLWAGATTEPRVEFVRDVTVETPGAMTVYTTGKGYVLLNETRFPIGETVTIPAGQHRVTVRIMRDGGLPAAYVASDTCPSGEGWVGGSYPDSYVPVGWMEAYDSPESDPHVFPFAYETKVPVSQEKAINEKGQSGIFYDFGREMFGCVDIAGLDPTVQAGVFYGESREEALAHEEATLFEYLTGKTEARLTQRAFRYLFITGADGARVTAQYEYLPLRYRGSFRCSDALVNQIWDMCAYTVHLCSRETFLDGIKRDRWPWSGDAYQSYKINAYLFMDQAIDQRTSIGLRGKDPVKENINTILDYSLYWLIALDEYYMTYGDKAFLAQIWPRALTLMEFLCTREGEHGFLIGRPEDWTFIDWSEIDKVGACAAEQMLYIQTLRSMAHVAEILGEDGSAFRAKADALVQAVNESFWDVDKGAFIDSYASGKRNVTRHANIFAIMFAIATETQRTSIIQNVLFSDTVTKITTPYFKGFELDVLCRHGYFDEFEAMLHSYWGAMMGLGATTVWEQFDPTQTGIEHYGMYNSYRFTKSLCHAWGGTPVYLLGRYYLGVYPTAPGYAAFRVEPNPGKLGDIEGTVPVGAGDVRVCVKGDTVTVYADVPGGTLFWKGQEYAIPAGETLTVG